MRYPEIDMIKGIAVILMVIFHFFYLAYFMNIKNYPIDSGILNCMAKFAHTVFILIVGVNLALSYQKAKVKKMSDNEFLGKSIKRSFFLFLAGTIVSIFSYLAFDSMFVKFGIFQFIATAIIISQFVLKNHILQLFWALIVILVFVFKDYFSNMLYDNCLKIPLICFVTGLYNVKYSSLDHFPLIPYLTFVFLGMFMGNLLYKKGNRNFDGEIIDKLQENSLLKMLSFLGKRSLQIYFIHFPILYFLLFYYKDLRKGKESI